MITPPPRSTLFPYTTLFRSHTSIVGRRSAAGTTPSNRTSPSTFPNTRDRKSTRLNSSHQIISYAVFCLKKKNVLADTLHPASLHRVMRERQIFDQVFLLCQF